MMNNLIRIVIAIAIVLVVFIYFDNPVHENKLITGSNNTGQVIPDTSSEVVEVESVFTRPKEGISTLVGGSSQAVIEMLGKPTRTEPSAFGYEWWIYNKSLTTYLLIGVEGEKVTQAFAAGANLEVAPYKIGQNIDEIYRFTIVQSEITFSIDSNTYTFTLTEEDIDNRILVQFDNLFAMLYIDSESRQLEAVRFTDPKTILLHKPYDILYNGIMVETKTPDSLTQAAIDRANERQIFELSNVYRLRNSLRILLSDNELQKIAMNNSEEMARNNVVVNEKFEISKFSDQLKESSIEFSSAAGNTAAFYFDAGEAVNGWMNSKDHREILLGQDFTHTGIGVYGSYYTQNFIERKAVNTTKNIPE
ncbi:CAP domain-containing protein [Psychrobacillus antarcticus]|uniref:CAP domain-containing protein n=1 Tax=Psychrobacillus antarcticus TaxID=2879115 RepID=UPI002407A886|nr:CAP-associated domain-containing protein [Psychrobacillus antarcticus]